MFYYSVIPILRLPRNVSLSFTYSSPEKIIPGTLVRIVFRKRPIYGIVLKKTKRPQFPVLSIVWVGGFCFPHWYLQFVQLLPNEIFEHPGTILKAVLNKVLWPRLLKSQSIQRWYSTNNKTHASDRAYKSYESHLGRLSFLSNTILEAQKKRKSLLILIPSRVEVNRIYLELTEQFPQLELFTSETKPSKVTQWLVTHHPLSVIATRIGVFLPIRFDMIICDDYSNELYYHQEPAPTYDARTIAHIVSQYLGARLMRSGYSFPLTCYPDISIYRCIGGAQLSAVWVDMKEEVEKGNYLFSEHALRDIQRVPTLLITSSKSFSQKVICRICGYLFFCPQCDRPYQAVSEHELLCPSCKSLSILPPFCPSCGSTKFSYARVGAGQVKARLKQMLSMSDSALPAPYPSFKNTEVCAFSEIERFDLSLFQKVVIVSFESLLSQEFDSLERVVHKLIKLQKNFQGELVIQYHSANVKKLFLQLQQSMLGEMKLRKKFSYPPYGDLYTIRYRPHSSKGLSELKAKQIVADSFSIPLDSVLSSARKKRRLPFMEFNARVKKNHQFNWQSLPQEFHIFKY